MLFHIFLQDLPAYSISKSLVINNMWDTLLMAFALILVLEGLLPFLTPGLWRETFRKLTEANDGQIRFIGLTSMLLGLLLLYFVK